MKPPYLLVRKAHLGGRRGGHPQSISFTPPRCRA